MRTVTKAEANGGAFPKVTHLEEGLALKAIRAVETIAHEIVDRVGELATKIRERAS